jgi:hypothetical protein
MRKLFALIAFAACFCSTAVAAEEECIIPMMVVVPDQPKEVPISAKTILEAKLRQAITQNGIEGGAKYAYFMVVGNMEEVGKQVIGGTRPLVTLTLDVQLYVVNQFTGDKFAMTTVTVSGAARNDQRAYSTALSALTQQNKQIQQFLKSAKDRISNYYDTQANQIITMAKNKAATYDFEEAMYLLTTVPVCSKQYKNVEKAMREIFQNFIDYDCAAKIGKAMNIWNATQDREGALLAGAYLSAIDPNSACYEDAMVLADEIRLRIGEQWEFAKDLQRDAMRDAVAIELARIAAMRAIGKAWGENQQPVTINNLIK